MCVGCGACIEVCPAQCITLNPFATIDHAYCTMCGSCENTYPYDAIGWTEVLTKVEE
ncbi:MAG: 4Fe-4S dicluster domain-containing protein [Solobacterium sp.]|nr:4Fe-4S dicluster domain-containing protein [Solobacterium sp.]